MNATHKAELVSDEEQIEIIEESMHEIETLTCVSFERQENQKDFILFQRSEDCASDIGRIGGKQEVELADDCFDIKNVQHELLHILGFDHMQSHFDRDDYITLDEENTDNPYQFEKVDSQEFSDFGQGYDFESIMHYDSRHFSIDEAKHVIIPNEEIYFDVINRHDKKLSEKDIKSINMMYQCETNEVES